MSINTERAKLNISRGMGNGYTNYNYYDIYYESHLSSADKIDGNLAIVPTKSKLKDAHGKITATYRDRYQTIIMSSKRIVIRPNFTRVGKGQFCYEYIRTVEGRASYVRNIPRHIPMTDSEVFELALHGKIIEVDENKAIDFVKDIFEFMCTQKECAAFVADVKGGNIYESYIDSKQGTGSQT